MYVETLGGLVDADTLDGVPSTVLSLLGLYGLDGCHGVVGGCGTGTRNCGSLYGFGRASAG